MSEHYDSDPPEEIGGVPVDSEIGGLPPVDKATPPPVNETPDSGSYDYAASDSPVEPRIPRQRKSKTKFRSITSQYKSAKRSRFWASCMVLGVVLFCCSCWLLCCGIVAALGGAAAVMATNEVSEDGAVQLPIESTDDNGAITLSVDNPAGRVRIRPGDTDEVKVEYTKKAFGFTTDMSRTGLDDISVTLDNAGNADQFVLTVEKGDGPLRFMDHVNLTVYVPPDVHLAIDTNTGEIDVGNVNVHSMHLNANTGAVTFEGTLESDAGARFYLETNTGAVIVKLPYDVDVRVDASAHTGSVEVASTFNRVSVESEDMDGPSQSWLGTLGEGSGDAPKLTLRSNTGAIVVESR